MISSGVIAERAPERGEAADLLVVGELGERAAVGAGEDDLGDGAHSASSARSARTRWPSMRR